MRVLCVFGEHQYGDPLRGEGTEYSAFIPALHRLGHEVLHFESWNKAAYKDIAELNAKLLVAVESFRPDVMLTVHMEYEIWIETLEMIRARGDVATISWATDDSWKYREVSRFVGGAYHAMTTTYDYVIPRYHADGVENVLLTQWAVSSDWLVEPLPAEKCSYPVSFVGAAHGDRESVISALKARGIEVACFGHGWPSGAIAMTDIPDIMRKSVISLNFSNSRGKRQIKARAFEVPGAGGFLLSADAPGLERCFVLGKEIAVFSDIAELVEQIEYFLSNLDERDLIALAGHFRTRKDHTYEQRLSQVLEYALAAKARTASPPCTYKFDVLRKRHALTPMLRVLRSILVGFGRLLFGPARGPRAARRLVFELSWRIAGRHTFTAAGWPGRMFPDC